MLVRRKEAEHRDGLRNPSCGNLRLFTEVPRSMEFSEVQALKKSCKMAGAIVPQPLETL